MNIKSNIAFIIPPSNFLIDDKVFINLGVLYVATSLEAAGHNVAVLDLSGDAAWEKTLGQFCSSNKKTLIFGFTATTPQFPMAVNIAKELRSLVPNARLILGGTHATLVCAGKRWEEKRGISARSTKNVAKLEDFFDVIVVGDGELAIHEAIRPDAPKFINADDRRSSLFIQPSSFSTLFPSRHLLDLKSYKYTIDGKMSTSLISQRGCPFACGFCGGRHTAMLRGSRLRTVNSVIDEIGMLYTKYGYTGFMFYDDELNVNPHFIDLLLRLSALQKDYGERFALRGFVKAELLTDLQAEAMAAAGFHWVLSGFESGSQRMLSAMNKSARLEDNTRCVAIAKKHGLKVKALMSLGHPGESRETLLETMEWLAGIAPDDFDLTTITPYPGSAYYDHAVLADAQTGVWKYTARTGDVLYHLDKDYSLQESYYKGIPGAMNEANVYTDFLSARELAEQRDLLDAQMRSRLCICPPTSQTAAASFEHSMGQH